MRFAARPLVLIAALLAAGNLQAQTNPLAGPGKPLTLVVPTSSATGSDISSRLIGPKLAERLGRAVVIENRTGASGSIGISSVAKAAPDGMTILVTPSSMAVLPHLSKSVNWDPIKDFVPVARLAGNILSLIISPKITANSVSDFVALARGKPGQLNYASPGVGTPHHLVAEMFKQATGVKIVHIPYKTSAAAVTDLAGGQVDVGFFPVHSAMPLIKAGKLRLLATISDQRTPWTPEIPTIREAGVDNVFYNAWTGVFLPRNTPRDIVAALSRELLAILALPGMGEAMLKDGLLIMPGGPEEMAAMLKKDTTVWAKVIKDAGISPE